MSKNNTGYKVFIFSSPKDYFHTWQRSEKEYTLAVISDQLCEEEGCLENDSGITMDETGGLDTICLFQLENPYNKTTGSFSLFEKAKDHFPPYNYVVWDNQKEKVVYLKTDEGWIYDNRSDIEEPQWIHYSHHPSLDLLSSIISDLDTSDSGDIAAHIIYDPRFKYVIMSNRKEMELMCG